MEGLLSTRPTSSSLFRVAKERKMVPANIGANKKLSIVNCPLLGSFCNKANITIIIEAKKPGFLNQKAVQFNAFKKISYI